MFFEGGSDAATTNGILKRQCRPCDNTTFEFNLAVHGLAATLGPLPCLRRASFWEGALPDVKHLPNPLVADDKNARHGG